MLLVLVINPPALGKHQAETQAGIGVTGPLERGHHLGPEVEFQAMGSAALDQHLLGLAMPPA